MLAIGVVSVATPLKLVAALVFAVLVLVVLALACWKKYAAGSIAAAAAVKTTEEDTAGNDKRMTS